MTPSQAESVLPDESLPCATAPRPREVDIVRPAYQPYKAEPEEDLRVVATFEEAVQAFGTFLHTPHLEGGRGYDLLSNRRPPAGGGPA